MGISSHARTATASTLFFTNLLRLNRSPPVVAPLATPRSFFSGIDRSIQTEGAPPNYPDEEMLKQNVEYLKSAEHPFIRRGPPSPYFGCVSGERDKIYLRIDMPGVGKEGLKIRPENNYFVIEGVENDHIDDEDDQEEIMKRVYSHEMFFDPAYVFKDGINAVIKNGVSRIVFSLRLPS